MSSESPPKGRIIDKVTRSFEKLSHLWPPSSMNMDSSSDNPKTEREYRSTLRTSVGTYMAPSSPTSFSSSSLVDRTSAPLVGVDHALATAVTRTEAPKLSPISVPVSTSISTMSIQSGPETSLVHNVHSSSFVVQMSPESEQNPSELSGLGLFYNAHNVLITGGAFNNIVNVLPAERQMKIPVVQKPNSSLMFTGRRDVLDKLAKIFCADSTPMSRCSCLLWGMGGIGKTQICLKFTEEKSDSFSHIFWVDASSYESMTTSIKGLSSIPAAQASGVDGLVGSVLQWISSIPEEWLMVFDNVDNVTPEMVAKFIPPGNRGNILITSRNQSMGRLVSSENIIGINEMEKADAVSLLLKASHINPLPEHVQSAERLVIELGCIPLAVEHAGAYINAGNSSIDDYLRQLPLHYKDLMSDDIFRGTSNYDQSPNSVWDLGSIIKRNKRES